MPEASAKALAITTKENIYWVDKKYKTSIN